MKIEIDTERLTRFLDYEICSYNLAVYSRRDQWLKDDFYPHTRDEWSRLVSVINTLSAGLGLSISYAFFSLGETEGGYKAMGGIKTFTVLSEGSHFMRGGGGASKRA